VKFKDIKGKIVSLDEIISLIKEEYDYTVYVGTDSQVKENEQKVQYATCIVLHKNNKGGRIFVSKEKKPKANSLRERLMNEVWRSVEISFQLSEHLPDNANIMVHVDVNPDKKWKSSKHIEELVGMVVGQGFKCQVKPNAWAAQSVADQFTK